MSVAEVGTDQKEESNSRKRNAETAEIEIDINAPEPPSKKSLRKSKRAKSSTDQNLKASGPETESSTVQQNATGDQKRSQHGIWIGNLSFSTTQDDLLTFLTTKSEITIPRDDITRIHLPQGPPKFGKASNKGFAYVDFLNIDSLNAALGLSEALLAGRRVLIKNAKDFEGRPQPKSDKEKEGMQTKAPSKRIFVGNLDFETTVENLEEHFGLCGSVVNTHMATFEDSGKCKGFAWIEFDQLASAEAAMRGWIEPREPSDKSSTGSRPSRTRIWLQKLNGRRLRMEYAEDKASRYQKRFGKNSNSSDSPAPAIEEVNGDSEPALAVRRDQQPTKRKYSGKYAEETVQKLTGAIVESQGQRTVFE